MLSVVSNDVINLVKLQHSDVAIRM